MDKKKGATILIIIAIVLAIAAISVNMMDSDVRTTGNVIRESSGNGDLGIVIIPGEVEDKYTQAGAGP